jgi:hypothetical protein
VIPRLLATAEQTAADFVGASRYSAAAVRRGLTASAERRSRWARRC